MGSKARARSAQRGLKLDMGKACPRFKSLDDLLRDVIGAVIASMPPEMLIAAHESVHAGKRRRGVQRSARPNAG